MIEIAHLAGRRVLAVSGEDRVSYLQGLVSNDVALAAPGRAVWAALLTPQGKWLADFFVTAEGERLLLDVDAGQAEMLAARLMRFRLRAKVAVEATALPVHAGWPGPAPEGAWPDPRLEAAGWRSFAEMQATVDEAAYDRHRLSLGLPDGPRDLEAEKTILLEAGFDELNGVSWTKGCYMGQELTARTKYRGLVKRRLMPVTVAGAMPEPGTPVLRDGAEVGAMRSGRDGAGIALLRLDAGAGPFACGAAELTPARPGWMRVAA